MRASQKGSLLFSAINTNSPLVVLRWPEACREVVLPARSLHYNCAVFLFHLQEIKLMDVDQKELQSFLYRGFIRNWLLLEITLACYGYSYPNLLWVALPPYPYQCDNQVVFCQPFCWPFMTMRLCSSFPYYKRFLWK